MFCHHLRGRRNQKEEGTSGNVEGGNVEGGNVEGGNVEGGKGKEDERFIQVGTTGCQLTCMAIDQLHTSEVLWLGHLRQTDLASFFKVQTGTGFLHTKD